jgi:peptidoglycan L-alanyl-D-glutamate endopeptidase CwlK
MRALREGLSGADVRKLQKKLKERGIKSGRIDGIFGQATRNAVIDFQRSNNLQADGIAGKQTLAALGLTIPIEKTSVISLVTADLVAQMFPHTPQDNIRENLPYILTALENEQLTYKNIVLTTLATVRAETESFEPLSEFISRYNTSPGGHPFDLYDYRRDLGNLSPPDGERYRGRGFIQLTGRINYQQYVEEIGLDNQLIDNPELANPGDVAAKLLAAFFKDKEARISETLLSDDLRTARKMVNGGSHGLDRFTDAYRIGEKLIAYKKTEEIYE